MEILLQVLEKRSSTDIGTGFQDIDIEIIVRVYRT